MLKKKSRFKNTTENGATKNAHNTNLPPLGWELFSDQGFTFPFAFIRDGAQWSLAGPYR